MSVLNAVLGGGMSSRLFQEVRERRGLAYSVYSFASGYSDAGWFGLYAGCAPGEGRRGRHGCCRRAGGARRATASADDELARAKGQVGGGLVLGLEDSGSRMTPARPGRAGARRVRVDRRDRSRRCGAVTADDVRALAAELAARPRSLAVVGPFDEDRALRRAAGL